MNNTILNCRGHLLDISKPVVMGILNVTPDSFFDGGKFNDVKNMMQQVEKMLTAGAKIIDAGAVSSRPGAEDVTENTEWQRLEPVLKLLTKEFPGILISVDTFRSSIALKSLEAGASIINDITSGKGDDKMLKTVASYDASYIMMHMQGSPKTMQKDPRYENVTLEIIAFFIERIAKARFYGIKDIIVDPGFGFGKTTAHNFQLLNDLNQLKITGCPVMAGLSRKSMVNSVLGTKPENALNGTTVLNTIALLKGASILRVHDVKEAVETIMLVEELNKNI